MDSRHPVRRPRRGLLLAGGVCLSAVVATWAAWSAYLVWPRGDEVSGTAPADAVVVLAGADDGRHDLAVRLAADGVAPVLLVSNPEGEGEPKAWSLCHGQDRPAGVEVQCLRPEPRTTWGEALAVRRIAEERGWREVVVVTNRPHTLRARGTVRRAAGVEVRMCPVDEVDWMRLPLHALREAAGFAKGGVLGRW